MAEVVLLPELITPGGEIHDVMVGGQYAGTLTLVYREKDRLSGSLQLEKGSLKPQDKERVIRHVTRYIESFIEAVKAGQCEVLVTYSPLEQVIAPNGATLEEAEEESDGPEAVWAKEKEADRMESNGNPTADKTDGNGRKPVVYELVLTKQHKQQREYHVYNHNREWIGEVFTRTRGRHVTGSVHWMEEPSDEEIEAMTDLVVSDFDTGSIDSFSLDHLHEGEVIETVELTHEDDWLEEDRVYSDTQPGKQRKVRHRSLHDDYTIVLARDDQDVLTYEIYKQSDGGLPIGTATIDISQRQLSGYVDFRDNVDQPGEREKICALIMQELDKEKDYDTISFTIMHQNRPVDEIIFENETAH